jgi:uncharacterized protein DUF5995
MIGSIAGAWAEAAVAAVQELRTELAREYERRGEPVPGSGWATAQGRVAKILARPVQRVVDVRDTLIDLQAVLDGLPPGAGLNRIASFNGLYATVTGRVLEYLEAGRFADATFLETLDVEFGKLYFAALAGWGTPLCPASWSVLFGRAQDLDVSPVVAAAAGVNMHIDFDLRYALVATWRRLGRTTVAGPEHPDYRLVNKIFFAEMPDLRGRVELAWQRLVDRLDGPLDDWTGDLLVALTRQLAWYEGEQLWQSRADPAAFARRRSVMDRSTAMLGLILLDGDRVAESLWDRLSGPVRGLVAACSRSTGWRDAENLAGMEQFQ